MTQNFFEQLTVDRSPSPQEKPLPCCCVLRVQVIRIHSYWRIHQHLR